MVYVLYVVPGYHATNRLPTSGGVPTLRLCSSRLRETSSTLVRDPVSIFRRVPPVHAAIRAGALWGAARAHLSLSFVSANGSALTRATTRLAAVYPGRDILLTDSGTSALMLALLATRPAAGSRACVALPAYACPDVGTAAIGAGYQIALYDVDPGTLAPDRESLQRCLVAGASHVVTVHLFGRLVDVAEVQRVAAPYGAVVIEDAAQHAGGTLRGVRGGALADWSVLSCGRGTGINAGGGGALLRGAGGRAAGAGLTELPAELPVSDMRASLAGLLKATAAELLSHPAVYWVPAAVPALHLGATVYHAPGVARAMTATSAMLLIEALDQESAALAGRAAAERKYLEGLRAVTVGGTPILPVYAAAEMASGALRVPVRLGREIAERLAPRGVVRSYPRTLADYPEIAERLIHRREALPGARLLADALYTLPTHARLRDAEHAEIIRILQVQR